MSQINQALSFAKKRLDLNLLYSDESLFNFFEYKSSFQDKLNKTEDNDSIYDKPFNDKEMNKFRCFENINLFRVKNDIKINFGRDPFNVNKTLMKKNKMNYLDDKFKYQVINYCSSVNCFHLFIYKENIRDNNDKVHMNRILELNWKRKIPYFYNNYCNDLFFDKCKFLLKKTILPTKYNNHVPVIVKDNRLLKKMVRKNRIIIMNNINMENKILGKIKNIKKKYYIKK